MPAGRPLSENRIYAQELGITLACMRRLGGADYLRSLPESSRRVVLRRSALKGRGWSLGKLGMTVCKPFSVQKRAEYEALVQEMLRERGLK